MEEKRKEKKRKELYLEATWNIFQKTESLGLPSNGSPMYVRPRIDCTIQEVGTFFNQIFIAINSQKLCFMEVDIQTKSHLKTLDELKQVQKLLFREGGQTNGVIG